MKFIKKNLPVSLLSLALVSGAAMADWQVDNANSSVYFISTKNINISEIHHFTQVSGKLTDNGQFSLDIDLASVETAIDIRNSRMREHLFKVDSFPKARVSATVPAEALKLTNGNSMQLELPATLTVMGIDKALTINALVSKTAAGQYVVSSTKPILLSAVDVGMQEGVEVLQKIAGLSSIGLTVPVSFNLQLN